MMQRLREKKGVWETLAFALFLLMAVMATYAPLWHAGFIWDDDDHVTANPCIVGPLGLKEIWTTSQARYYPLTLTTFWLEHLLWGLNPLPYHLVNVLMHGCCAIVLWRVLLRLQVAGARFGAALWALHPVQVETVAWIAELKNVQSCLFFLLAVLFFARWLTAEKSQRLNMNYALTLVFAALAMVSKSSTVVLPLVLCLCAWWLRVRWRWRDLAWLVPLFVMALASAGMAMWSVALYEGTHDPYWTRIMNDPHSMRGWPERLITAGWVFWFYLGKLAWPHPLIFIYPRWTVHVDECFSYLPLLAAIGLFFITRLSRLEWSRPCFFAASYFLVALLPILGLVEHYFLRYSFVADHLQYLASMGPMALVGAALASSTDAAKLSWVRPLFGGVLLLILGLLSYHRATVFETEEGLWTDTLLKNPSCWMARVNLGNGLLKKGQAHEAIAQYQDALAISQNEPEAYYDLANAYLSVRALDDAIVNYQRALNLNPAYTRAASNLGAALLAAGRTNDAIVEYQQALTLSPADAGMHYNLGLAYIQANRMNEAREQFQRTIDIDPGSAKGHNNLGLIFLHQGDLDAAVAEFDRAVQLGPNAPESHHNLALALARRGQLQEAIVQFQWSLALDPNNASIHDECGHLLLQMGTASAAEEQFQLALLLNPSDADAQNSLAVIRALPSQPKYP